MKVGQMLLSFKVSNFRSIREPLEFVLHRNKRIRSDSAKGSNWDESISSVAAIYGANASGKSSLFSSTAFLTDAVRRSYRFWEPGEETGRLAFALDSDCENAPTAMEIEFRASDGVDYQYGFEMNDFVVLKEWLYAYRTASRTLLFTRELNTGEDSLTFGNSFRGDKRLLREATLERPNALTLSVGGQLGNQTLSAAFSWLRTGFRQYSASEYEQGHQRVMDLIQSDSRFRDRLTRVLSRADLGVDAIDVVEEEEDPDFIERTRQAMKVMSNREPDETMFQRAIKESRRSITLAHSANGVDSVKFPFQWESEGTRALISFATMALDALADGSTCFVDELDSSLHPLLVAELVALFESPELNPKQAQLIFTTHDSSLLSAQYAGERLLARDQIWIVEKQRSGATSIVGLNEYKSPRKDENLERGYLSGRYGGVPVLSVLNALVLDSVEVSSAHD